MLGDGLGVCVFDLGWVTSQLCMFSPNTDVHLLPQLVESGEKYYYP